MKSERTSIRELLPSHVRLLEDHRGPLVFLASVAEEQGVQTADISFIVADARGEYGQSCRQAGVEFLVARDGEPDVMVILLGIDGLLGILSATIPEGVSHVEDRAHGTIPILVVDHEDEPAIIQVDAWELGVASCS